MNQETTPPPPRLTYEDRMSLIERIVERVLFFGSDEYEPRSYECADAARESIRDASGGDVRLLAYAAYLVHNLHAPHGLPERIAEAVRRFVSFVNDASSSLPPFANDPKRRFLMLCLYVAGAGEKSFIFTCGTWGKLAGLGRKEVYRFLGHAIKSRLLWIVPRRDTDDCDFHGIEPAMPAPIVRRRKQPTVYRLGDWPKFFTPFDDLEVLRVKPWANSLCKRAELLSRLGLDSAALRAMAQKRPQESAARKTGDEPDETRG